MFSRFALCAVFVTFPACANPSHIIGKFADWRVAKHGQGAGAVCYAYTRANPASSLPGRGDVSLTVTERSKLRDSVMISAGFTLTLRQDVKLQAGSGSTAFYPSGRAIFARNNAAALTLLTASGAAVLKMPSPKAGELQDRFSLNGFAAALSAARTACPAEAL